MKKQTVEWSVQELEKQFTRINFPEYQREPTVWSRIAKQRLVDSMLREFDISSLYFYVDDDDSIDCIDGRQRIVAIMSFLEENPEDDDNGFEFKLMNEIYEDEEPPFVALEGLGFRQIVQRAQSEDRARQLMTAFQQYKLTIVQLSGSRRPEEFNLQFTRLNVGTIINSGEKLHAMVGDLRDECFTDEGIGHHGSLETTSIPTRRFAREQVAAQILAQIFSLEETREFTRTRHFDLQRLFKVHAHLTDELKGWIEETRAILDLLRTKFDALSVLRNRAITISTVLLARKLSVANMEEAGQLARFIEEFLCRLQWQVRKGLDVDLEYRYLIDFQRHVTQASVERPAVEARADTLEEEYARWDRSGVLRGDDEYKDRTGLDPTEACREER